MLALRGGERPVGAFTQRQAERGIADRAAHEHAVTHLGAGAPHHAALRHAAEHGDGDGDRAGRAVGVAAEQRTAELNGIGAQAVGEIGQPVVAGLARQRQRQQEAERCRALGGEVGQVHPQRLARHLARRVVGEEMHAADNGVGLEHQVAARGRRDEGGIVGEAERARMGGERLEEARDQTILG